MKATTLISLLLLAVSICLVSAASELSQGVKARQVIDTTLTVPGCAGGPDCTAAATYWSDCQLAYTVDMPLDPSSFARSCLCPPSRAMPSHPDWFSRLKSCIICIEMVVGNQGPGQPFYMQVDALTGSSSSSVGFCKNTLNTVDFTRKIKEVANAKHFPLTLPEAVLPDKKRRDVTQATIANETLIRTASASRSHRSSNHTRPHPIFNFTHPSTLVTVSQPPCLPHVGTLSQLDSRPTSMESLVEITWSTVPSFSAIPMPTSTSVSLVEITWSTVPSFSASPFPTPTSESLVEITWSTVPSFSASPFPTPTSESLVEITWSTVPSFSATPMPTSTSKSLDVFKSEPGTGVQLRPRLSKRHYPYMLLGSPENHLVRSCVSSNICHKAGFIYTSSMANNRTWFMLCDLHYKEWLESAKVCTRCIARSLPQPFYRLPLPEMVVSSLVQYCSNKTDEVVPAGKPSREDRLHENGTQISHIYSAPVLFFNMTLFSSGISFR
ncbi:uncharacterized protein L3040_009574 [Drepanopeziza brunnea f. sp. 'multigermtubi']|uniref:uncharacterized protein n=1 Tax=Drepanopeziza brunnea f. sp. 'multigermtubi' TaxID=698441 RepID=UPI0023A0CE45|nr:hypothetical protein L3040_009574 [Drepanopeziza brunnea f. sp. 'multigermtubi']